MMRGLYIIATLFLGVSACQKRGRTIDWDAVDYGLNRKADSYREETHK